MDLPVYFTSHFANLVWLLAHRADAVDEQKAALRLAMVAVKQGKISLSTTEINFSLANGIAGEGMQQVHELATRMAGHSARQLEIAQHAPAAEVLAVARLMADEPRHDDGEAFDAKLAALSATAITATLGRGGFVRRATPTEPQRAVAGPARAPSPTPSPMRALPAYPRATPPRGVDRLTAPNAAGTANGNGRTTPNSSRIIDETRAVVETAITSPGLGGVSEDELLGQLDAGVAMPNALRLLDEAATLAEVRALQQKWSVVTRIFRAVVVGEARAGDDHELRRAYTLAIRRMTKPTFLRAVASELPRHPEWRDELQDVLVRTGPEGADALIDLLTNAELMTDRRAYLAVLVKCRAAVPTLLHLLGDSRWFVVRNAADLLGEMQPVEAEAPLAEMATHKEERVRRAVATALCRVGTPRALQAALTLLEDPVPEVRVHAAAGLGATRNARAVVGLIKALDEEVDADVQLTMLTALGKAGTPDALRRLIKAAEPDSRLFRRKPLAYRVTAVQALGESSASMARAALSTLTKDRDREVRDAAARELAGRNRSPVSEL